MKSFSEQEIRGSGLTSQSARDRLVRELEQKGVTDSRVLGAMARTPRHLFLDSAFTPRAYEDIALPIGWQQTISQPSVVAIMAQALIEGREGEKPLPDVLEIGTGCGYNAAVLSCLARRVVSLERIGALHHLAAQRIAALGLSNIDLRLEDGSAQTGRGLFSGVIYTAACPEISQGWLSYLEVFGRLIAPVGPAGQQRLILIERTGKESLAQKDLGAVAFVPLLSGIQS